MATRKNLVSVFAVTGCSAQQFPTKNGRKMVRESLFGFVSSVQGDGQEGNATKCCHLPFVPSVELKHAAIYLLEEK